MVQARLLVLEACSVESASVLKHKPLEEPVGGFDLLFPPRLLRCVLFDPVAPVAVGLVVVKFVVDDFSH
jgi:hypothetical protein